MLSKHLRFHGHGSIKYLYQNARGTRTRYFTIKALHNPRRNKSRFSVVVSKKTHKSAVGRNRIRRRVYELLRHEQLQMNSSRDIAVIVTSGEALMAPHDELKKSLRDGLAQAGVYT